MSRFRFALLALFGNAVLGTALLQGLNRADEAFPPPIARATEASREVVDADGRLLRAFATSEGLWRLRTTSEDVDPQFVRMLLAYEDQRFYDHRGIDPLALLRAAGQFVGNGRIVSGASTLSMQVARLIEPRDGAAYALGPELNNAASQLYAAEGQCFVLAPCANVSKEMVEMLCTDEVKRQLLKVGGGFTRIYGPDGSPLAEPIPEDQEGIVYADLDLGMIPLAKAAADPSGRERRLQHLQSRFRGLAARHRHRRPEAPEGALVPAQGRQGGQTPGQVPAALGRQDRSRTQRADPPSAGRSLIV